MAGGRFRRFVVDEVPDAGDHLEVAVRQERREAVLVGEGGDLVLLPGDQQHRKLQFPGHLSHVVAD